PEERDAFVAGGGARREVHVLQDQADAAARDQLRGRVRIGRDVRLDVVEIEEELQRPGDAGLILDDQDLGHAPGQTLRVAMEGGTAVARIAGGMVDSKPLIHSKTMPAATSC